MDQPFDAGRVTPPHRGDQLGALELGVTLLEVGLPFVGREQLRRGHLLVVGDHRPHRVGRGVVGDLGLVDGEPDPQAGGDELLAGGVGAGTAPPGLPEALGGVLLDVDDTLAQAVLAFQDPDEQIAATFKWKFTATTSTASSPRPPPPLTHTQAA